MRPPNDKVPRYLAGIRPARVDMMDTRTTCDECSYIKNPCVHTSHRHPYIRSAQNECRAPRGDQSPSTNTSRQMLRQSLVAGLVSALGGDPLGVSLLSLRDARTAVVASHGLEQDQARFHQTLDLLRSGSMWPSHSRLRPGRRGSFRYPCSYRPQLVLPAV